MDSLFGGSFDPVHIGHLIVAEAAADALGSAVRFVPAREQPLKREGHGAPPSHRAAMLSRAISGNPRFSVESMELELPPPSFTVSTLRALARREPGNRFLLLLGADAARELPRWHDAEALPGLADVVVFARPGTEVPRTQWITRTIMVPAVDISATDIRARVAARQSIRYLVPEPVREYIEAHGLYR